MCAITFFASINLLPSVKIWWSTSLCEWWGDTLHLGVLFGSRMSASLGHSKEKKIVTSIVSKQELWCIYNFQAMLVITYFGFFGQKNNLFWIVIQWFVNLPICTKVSNWVIRVKCPWDGIDACTSSLLGICDGRFMVAEIFI